MVGRTMSQFAGSPDVYEAWLDRYESAYSGRSEIGTLQCPSCGHLSLTLAFIFPDPDLMSATSVFWCSSCHRGLMPNRAPLPPAHRRRVVDPDAVPDFEVVVPGP
jgi:hypothetical protein